MDRLTMSWNTEGCQLVRCWIGSGEKQSDVVIPTNEPLGQWFEDWNSDVVFELGDAA
jgi:hypothetical protein